MANNEWGTPHKYIESARKVMGSIDVDPASNEAAQQIVKAKTFYTRSSPGLDKPWPGNVWLNPPYGRGDAVKFVTPLASQYKAGIVKSAIVLTNNVPDTNWWSTNIGSSCSAVCLLDHRIAFINPETGEPERGNDKNQMFAYLGRNVYAFLEEFSQYGLCCTPFRS